MILPKSLILSTTMTPAFGALLSPIAGVASTPKKLPTTRQCALSTRIDGCPARLYQAWDMTISRASLRPNRVSR